MKFFVARLDVILVLFALKNVKRIPSRPVLIVEVELVFSHHEAAEKDQGGLQEKHQVWLRIEALFVTWFFWSVMNGPPNT